MCYKSQVALTSSSAQWSTEQIAPTESLRHGKGKEHLVNFQNKHPVQTPDCIKTKKWPDQQKFAIQVLKPKCYFLLAFLSVSFQNMVTYIVLPIVIFVLDCSLTFSEEAVTSPDTSCFIPH